MREPRAAKSDFEIAVFLAITAEEASAPHVLPLNQLVTTAEVCLLPAAVISCSHHPTSSG